jgi:hypothetical protein
MTTTVQEETGTAIARGQLREALRAVKVAEQTAVKAQDVATRASQGVAKAQGEMKRYADLDEQVHKHRIDILKRAGGAIPSFSAELKEDLRAALQARDEAAAEVKSAAAVSRELHAELDVALGEHQRAKKSAEDSAAEVILAEIETVVAELREVCARRWHLRMLIENVSLHYGGVGIHQRVQHLVAEGLEDNPRQLPVNREPEARASQWWQNFASRLAADPEATMGKLPSESDLWR